MALSIELAAQSAPALRQAALDSDQFQAAVKPGDKVFLAGAPAATGEPYTLRQLESEQVASPVTGSTIARYTAKPRDTQVTLVRALTGKFAPPAPLGYLIPKQWQELIDLLHRHGVKTEALPRPVTATFDTVHFDNVRFATAPFEGRFQVTSFSTRSVSEPRTLHTGSVFVPIAQRAGKVAIHILEPEAPDSALRWGFFPSIFEQKEYFSDYIFEPYAVEMLKQNSTLKAEFDQKLAADPAFAKNPRARLLWLFQRSPYAEPDKDAYPVIRTLSKPQPSTSEPTPPNRRTP